MAHRTLGPSFHNLARGLGCGGKHLAPSYDPTVKPLSPVWNSGHSLASGMVCAYLFNEGTGTSLVDSTGNLASATRTNGNWTTAPSGNCIAFTNGNSKVTLPDLTSQFGSNEASLLIVLKMDSAMPADYGHAGLMDFSDGIYDTLYPYTDGLISETSFHSVRVTNVTPGATDRTAWHRLGISTKNGTNNRKMYQNGVLFHTANGESSIHMTTTPTIGKSKNVYGYCQVATVMIWNRALSGAEFAELENDLWVMFR